MTKLSNYIQYDIPLSNYLQDQVIIWHDIIAQCYDVIWYSPAITWWCQSNYWTTLWLVLKLIITVIIHEQLYWIFIELMRGKSLKTVLLTILVFMARQVLRLKFNKVGNQNFMNINMTSRVNRGQFYGAAYVPISLGV